MKLHFCPLTCLAHVNFNDLLTDCLESAKDVNTGTNLTKLKTYGLNWPIK